MPGAAFFDLDRTLLDTNSAHSWLRHEWRAGRVKPRTVLRALWFFGRYALGDDTLGDALADAAALYTGVPEATMDARVRAWFRAELAHRLRPGAAPAIASHRSLGEPCVVATSSSQFAAQAAQDTFGLDHAISTVVEVVDGRLTGRLAGSAFGTHKLDACAEWAASRGIALADCAFYTDSYSDLPLLEAVGRPVVVHPDRRLQRHAARRGWPVVDWSGT